MTNEELSQEINGLFDQAKGGRLTERQAIFDAVEDVTERYFAANDEMPPANFLDRLSTLCLREELTDMDSYKMAHNEYPVMSGRQQERRQDEEISHTWTEEIGQDGTDYRPKTRDTNRKMHEISGDY
ncbi:hypothetical protein [Salibacterium lacus]|uniref:Uncharacterized protein n=1 Tax=Salibacterium lacus TaxID=1898109 RepID=A0ABW5SY04_9BACI